MDGMMDFRAAEEARRSMIDYHLGFYPPLVSALYGHVREVTARMDDAVNHPFVPRERFDAMAAKILRQARDEGILLGYGDCDCPRCRRKRRECDGDDPLRALIVALLIGELLKRRKCCP